MKLIHFLYEYQDLSKCHLSIRIYILIFESKHIFTRNYSNIDL
jgi:hypothetical protein